MRRTIVFAAGIATAALAAMTAASAQPGLYISGEAGPSFLPDMNFNDATSGKERENYDTGFLAGGALGYDTGYGLRLEVNSLYQQTSLNRFTGTTATGHLSTTSLTANATFDVLPNPLLTPYVGAGLGVENLGGTVDGDRGRAWKPAYQLEAGLRHDITDQVSLFGEYRFAQAEDTHFSAPTDTGHQPFADHALLAGLSFKLNE